jgi:copper homeostasis protein
LKLEVCVADPASLAAAIAGGADRIELCSALELGGLTPLPGLMAQAAKAPMPVYAMVRPRSGDFVYGAEEIDAMLRDIDAVGTAGLAGVVIGANGAEGQLDGKVLGRLVTQAQGLGLTLHRAFDLVPNVVEATELAVELGFERILTSGGAPTALEGLGNLALTHATARGRVAIMAGSGLKPDNVGRLLDSVPVDDVHSSCAGPGIASEDRAVRFGFAPKIRRVTDAAVVRAMKAALAGR